MRQINMLKLSVKKKSKTATPKAEVSKKKNKK